MPGGRRGLVAPQNTFLENIIRRSNSQREYTKFNLIRSHVRHACFVCAFILIVHSNCHSATALFA